MIALSLSACGGDETTTDNDTDSSITQNQADVSGTSSTEQATDTTSSTANNSGSSNITDIPSPTTSAPTTTTKPETSKPTTTTKPSAPVHTHSYSGATCTAPAKCSCGAIQGEPTGHVFDGENDENCNKCNFKRKINCTHKNLKIVSGCAATCENKGLTDGKICNDCGVFVVKQNSIAAKGHKVVTDKAVVATCTKNGSTEGSHCETCGSIIKQQTSIPKTEHLYGSWKIIKAATATKEGTKEKVCSCGHKITETIPKLPTKTVEITLDNWDEYFDITEDKEISRNGFNEIDKIWIYNRLSPKQKNIIKYAITVEISYDHCYYYCSIDQENQDVIFSAPATNGKVHTEIREISSSSHFLTLNSYYNNNNIGARLSNMKITRISGNITIVEQQ